MLGSGIIELRLGAGAATTCPAVVQIEALPVLFGNRGWLAMSGLFSFSVESINLTIPSVEGRGMVDLLLVFPASG